MLPATVAAVFACRGAVAAGVAAGGRTALVWLRLLALRVYLPMLVAFVVASPFVVLDAPHFLRDFRRQNQIMDRGWLGFENVGNGFWYNVTPNLTGAIGVVLVVIALAGLGWALWRRTRLDLLVAPYAVVYVLYVSTWKELADRYLIPLLPLLILLGGAPLPGRRPGPPAAWWRVSRAGGRGGAGRGRCGAARRTPSRSTPTLGGHDTREAAAMDRGERARRVTIATENYGPPLVREDDLKPYPEAGLEAPAAFGVIRARAAGARADEPVARPGLGARSATPTTSSPAPGCTTVCSLRRDDYPSVVRLLRGAGRAGELVREFRPGRRRDRAGRSGSTGCGAAPAGDRGRM